MGLLSMREAAKVLKHDVVSKTDHEVLAHEMLHHRSVLDYMGECNLDGRRMDDKNI